MENKKNLIHFQIQKKFAYYHWKHQENHDQSAPYYALNPKVVEINGEI